MLMLLVCLFTIEETAHGATDNSPGQTLAKTEENAGNG